MATYRVTQDLNGVCCDSEEDGGRVRVDDDPVTPESIAAAKEATRRERQRIFAATGIRIHEDGTFTLPPKFIIGCPRSGCRYTASAQREGQAVQAIGCHLIRVHCWHLRKES